MPRQVGAQVARVECDADDALVAEAAGVLGPLEVIAGFADAVLDVRRDGIVGSEVVELVEQDAARRGRDLGDRRRDPDDVDRARCRLSGGGGQ